MPVHRTPAVTVAGLVPGKPSPFGRYADWYGDVDFDRDAFTSALSKKGYDVVWEKATICPNRSGPSPLAHKITCTICDGSGYLYFESCPTKMLMTSIGMSQSFYAFGSWMSGTQMVTALPEMRLHPFDRLVLHNGVARFHELLRRQPKTLRDRPKYAPLCIENVSWVNRSGVLVTFKSGDHFIVDINGYVVWSNDIDRPDDNDTYSIAYTYRPRYVVIDLTHHHRESTVDGAHYEFPVQATARLEYLIRDESKDAPEGNDQSPFPPK